MLLSPAESHETRFAIIADSEAQSTDLARPPGLSNSISAELYSVIYSRK